MLRCSMHIAARPPLRGRARAALFRSCASAASQRRCDAAADCADKKEARLKSQETRKKKPGWRAGLWMREVSERRRRSGLGGSSRRAGVR